MNRVAIYLRKSRADLEAESRGEGETLSKHRKALLKLAKEKKLNIVNIKEEIVSGESIIHRPKMLELLKEIESNQYDALLCMDMERLGRGNMQDQGLILETLRNSKTKIITPRKTYDLDNEFDEEYSEFEAFMARKELKMITRRMQGGRIRSVEEGNYIATHAPYGYDIKKENSGRYLIINEEQAKIVRLIFDLYTNERLGSEKIATKLNQLGYKTIKGKEWRGHSILNIIKNEVYTGIIQWKKKEQKKSKTPGKLRDTRTRPKEEWIQVDGKHEAIITKEKYKLASDILKKKYHIPYQLERGVVNPLAGIMICGKCGNKLSRRPYSKQPPHLICHNANCNNRSTKLDFVENRIIDGLQNWLDAFQSNWDRGPSKPNKDNVDLLEVKKAALLSLEKEKDNLNQQKNNLHDFLEQGIYDADTFVERSQVIATKIHDNETKIEKLINEIKLESQRKKSQEEVVPLIRNVLKSYSQIQEPHTKNKLLRSVLEQVIYTKESHQRGDDFKLELQPKITMYR